MPALLHPPLPSPKAHLRWHQLYGAARSLALAEAIEADTRPYLVIARDARELDQLRAELGFFLGDAARIHVLPDWEVLPYDVFSPHPDIISERLSALAEMPRLGAAVILAAADTLASAWRRAATSTGAPSISRWATNCPSSRCARAWSKAAMPRWRR